MPLIDGISRLQLQQLAITTLQQASTLAGMKVFEPRDWPSTLDQFPIILVQTPRERKVSLGRGVPQFNTTITLVVVARVASTSEQQANTDMVALSEQIEDALISTTAFVSQIQQFASIETQSVVTADSRYHVGEVGMKFEVEVYQLYGPNDGAPLLEIQGTVTTDAGTALVSFDNQLPQ